MPPGFRRAARFGGWLRDALGLHMKPLLTVALLAAAFGARADHAPSEPPLTAENKARLVQILGEALRDKDISQEQYEHSISWVNATPCDGVDRHLEARRQARLEAVIAKQQGRKKVKVFESFKSDGWFILFTDASDGDEPYLFYSKDPVKGSPPLTAWSGAATIFETSEVAQWVKQNAPGISVRLANCFAWHVTLNPE